MTRSAETGAASSGIRELLRFCARHKRLFAAGLAASLLFNSLALLVPPVLHRGTDALIERQPSIAATQAGWLIALTAVIVAARILARQLAFSGAYQVERDLRRELASRLLSASSQASELTQGQLLTRLTVDLAKIRGALTTGGINPSVTFVVYLFVFPVLFATDATLGVAAVVSFLGTMGAMYVVSRGMLRNREVILRETESLSSDILEVTHGMATIRAYDCEPLMQARFDQACDRSLSANLRNAHMLAWLPVLNRVGPALLMAVLLGVAGRRITDGRMTMGEFVELSAYVLMLLSPTIAIVQIFTVWHSALASLQRFRLAIASIEQSNGAPGVIATLDRSLELRQLGVTYRHSAVAALDGINVVIPARARVAVVGPAGSGKTTLLRAIAGLIDVRPGSMLWDGVDVTGLSREAVRRNVSYSPQDGFLFSMTLADNIRFAAPDASPGEVLTAATAAQLMADPRALPAGLDTMVEPRSTSLSGGQRMRASLARALAADRPLLILDDPLAAVDPATESHIVDALEQYRGRTTIVATHRLGIARTCDLIMVLEAGRLVEHGTERELVAAGGVYARMLRRHEDPP